MTRALRVAIDSNILISAARTGKSVLGRLWTIDGIDILVSQFVIGESMRHLQEPGQRARLWHLLYMSHLIPDGDEVILSARISLPVKDQPVLRAAIAGRAEVFVTGDLRHFTPLFGQLIAGVLVESTETFRLRYPQQFPAGRMTS